MPQYRLRELTEADLPTMVRHRRNMWMEMGTYAKKDLDAADRVYRRWARKRLRDGTLFGKALLAPGGEIAASGCVWMRLIHPRPGFPGGPEPYLLSFFVEPRHRRNALATRLVKEFTRWAKRNGHPRMTLHASDAGRFVYEKLGWVRTMEMKLDLSVRS